MRLHEREQRHRAIRVFQVMSRLLSFMRGRMALVVPYVRYIVAHGASYTPADASARFLKAESFSKVGHYTSVIKTGHASLAFACQEVLDMLDEHGSQYYSIWPDFIGGPGAYCNEQASAKDAHGAPSSKNCGWRYEAYIHHRPTM